MNRVMIAGTGSGCGKTTVTCAVLQALTDRGLQLRSFKCGPDYIDPMFHTKVIGVPSRNLDGFFMDREVLRGLLARNSAGADLSVLEGVMGYYDGIGMTGEASSCAVARETETPVILTVPCRGMSTSIEAVIQGFTQFRTPSGIRGVIFNELPPSLYPALKEYCARSGLRACGYLPHVAGAEIASRHLGLVTADEIPELRASLQKLARTAGETLDLDAICRLAATAGKLKALMPETPCTGRPVRIAVARDLAFCFYYEDNLDLLRELGCEIVPFSPISDPELPEGISGLLLGGGYPELHAEELEKNAGMRASVRRAVLGGLPTIAECGGYLYLHRRMLSPEGRSYDMTDVLPGTCRFTEKLQHFGYVTLHAQKDTILCRRGDSVRAHEFHRYVSDLPADTFRTEKGTWTWMSSVSGKNFVAGFPHLHFYADRQTARRFVEACVRYDGKKGETT